MAVKISCFAVLKCLLRAPPWEPQLLTYVPAGRVKLSANAAAARAPHTGQRSWHRRLLRYKQTIPDLTPTIIAHNNLSDL